MYKLILTVLLFTSCAEKTNKNKVEGESRFKLQKINFEAHTYILASNKRNFSGLTHDPNCKCFKFLWKYHGKKIEMIPNNIKEASPDGL